MPGEKGVSTFLNTGTIFYFFFLAIDLHLAPEEKATGEWDLEDRKEAVKELVYSWCVNSLGGTTGEGKWRIMSLVDHLGEFATEGRQPEN